MSSFNYEIIDDYVNGRLAGADLAAFEKQLNEDSDLAKEVKLYAGIEKELKDHIAEDKNRDALKTTLSNLNQQYFKDKKTNKLKRLWPYAIAAAAAIVLFILFNPLNNEGFDNKKLYASYTSQLYPFSNTERGSAEDSLISRAADLYNKKNFSEALPLFLQAQKNTHNDELKLVTAICLLQMNKDEEAITELDSIISGKSVFVQEALWYKAMILLKQNKLPACSNVLKLISTDSDRYKEAQSLLAKIKPQL